MSGKADFDKVIARLDAATNALAEKIRTGAAKLEEALRNAGALSTEEDAALASLNTTADALEAMGKDAADPVPEPTPEPGTGDTV
jgi:hypothetical protein